MKYAVTGPFGEKIVEVVDEERQATGQAVRAAERFRVRIDGTEYHVGWTAFLGETHVQVEGVGGPTRVVVEPEGTGLSVTIGLDHVDLDVRAASPIARRIEPAAARQAVHVRAPMPGLVVRVAVTAGQAIRPGETVAVIEAMKMQMELQAPIHGRVHNVLVTEAVEVAGGQIIATVEPSADAEPPGDVEAAPSGPEAR